MGLNVIGVSRGACAHKDSRLPVVNRPTLYGLNRDCGSMCLAILQAALHGSKGSAQYLPQNHDLGYAAVMISQLVLMTWSSKHVLKVNAPSQDGQSN